MRGHQRGVGQDAGPLRFRRVLPPNGRETPPAARAALPPWCVMPVPFCPSMPADHAKHKKELGARKQALARKASAAASAVPE